MPLCTNCTFEHCLDEDDLFSRRKLWLKFISGGFGNDGDGFGEKLTKPEVGGRAFQVAQVWNGSPPPLLSYLVGRVCIASRGGGAGSGRHD